MKNFVISLASAHERRKHIISEFGKHNVNFDFFDALTPDTAQDYAKSLGLNLNNASLTPGELACMMSHVAIWKKVIDNDIPYITVFEDDVYLGQDAEGLLNSDDWISPEWHIIKIEAFNKKVFLSSDTTQIHANNRQVAKLKGKNLGTAGYIISLQGAQIYLEYLFINKLLPLDELIFDDFINCNPEPVYQMIPALCIQEMLLNKDNPSLPSALLKDRRNRMDSEKMVGLSKIRRESNRVLLQLKKAILAKEVPFS